MPKKKYSAEYKPKIVLSILDGAKDCNEICSGHHLRPNMVRKWEQDFLANAPMAVAPDAERKSAQRKEADLKKKNDQMLKTIGQLTLERDFLQDCFRQVGTPIPCLPGYAPKD